MIGENFWTPPQAPTCAAAVANAFLNLQDEDPNAYPRIDQLKLQKLLFYGHAWWLAIRDGPLFDDDVEAWPWGPVVRDIYSQFADFKRAPIVGVRAKELVRSGASVLDYQYREPSPPDISVLSFLKAVWEAHKSYTGIQLSNATHNPGEPWAVVRDKVVDLANIKPRIPNDLIRDIFKAKLKK